MHLSLYAAQTTVPPAFFQGHPPRPTLKGLRGPQALVEHLDNLREVLLPGEDNHLAQHRQLCQEVCP